MAWPESGEARQREIQLLAHEIELHRAREEEQKREKDELRRRLAAVEEESARRANAVKACGEEIVALRSAAAQLQEQNRAMQRSIRRRGELDEAVANKLETLSADELRRALHRYVGAYREERLRRKEVTAHLAQVREELAAAKGLEPALRRLQTAHGSQAAALLEMQSRAAESAKLAEVVRSQELVIAQLEELLERALDPRAHGLPSEALAAAPDGELALNSSQDARAAAISLHRQLRVQVALNRQLEARLLRAGTGADPDEAKSARIHAPGVPTPASNEVRPRSGSCEHAKEIAQLRSELEEERTKRERAEEEARAAADGAAAGGASGTGEFSVWRFRCEQAEERARALEAEIEETAKRAAQEVASLRIKLHEKELQLLGGSGSPMRLGSASASGPAEPGPKALPPMTGPRGPLPRIESATRR
jgi:hypothetical protein